MSTGQSDSGFCSDRFIEDEAYIRFASKREQYRYYIDKYESRYRNRGYSQRRFCSEYGIKRHRFAYWRAELGYVRGENRESTLPAIPFVELEMAPSPRRPMTSGDVAAGGLAIRLARSGHHLYLDGAVNSSLLRQVVHVLERS